MMHAVDIHTLLLHLGRANPAFARTPHEPKELDAADGALLWRSLLSGSGRDRLLSPRKGFVALLDPLGSLVQPRGRRRLSSFQTPLSQRPRLFL